MSDQLSPKHSKQKFLYQNFLKDLDKFQRKKSLNYKDSRRLCQNTQYYYNDQFIAYESDRKQSYLEWQKENETNVMEEMEVIYHQEKKEEIIIDTKIETISDILKIIESNVFETDKSYNIDLESLHKIKDELQKLNEMVGLKNLKKSIARQLLYFIQGFANDSKTGDYKHTVLTGDPGTGKTELAKTLGTMYSKIGILKNNIFKKVTRTDLVAGYLGQTAIKTRKVIDDCMGGILFIDEAYSLQTDDMFAKESVDTLCEALSDHKKEFMVIIAGYEEELSKTFFKINNGLYSRFIWKFHIEPYTPNELFDIFISMAQSQGWTIDVSISKKIFEDKKDLLRDNGRSIEQLLLCIKICHATRVYGQKLSQKNINLEDINSGLTFYKENLKKDKEILFGLYI